MSKSQPGARRRPLVDVLQVALEPHVHGGRRRALEHDLRDGAHPLADGEPLPGEVGRRRQRTRPRPCRRRPRCPCRASPRSSCPRAALLLDRDLERPAPAAAAALAAALRGRLAALAAAAAARAAGAAPAGSSSVRPVSTQPQRPERRANSSALAGGLRCSRHGRDRASNASVCSGEPTRANLSWISARARATPGASRAAPASARRAERERVLHHSGTLSGASPCGHGSGSAHRRTWARVAAAEADDVLLALVRDLDAQPLRVRPRARGRARSAP